MKSTRFSAFNIGTGRDPYSQGLQPYAEFPAYGQVAEKPFANIPTAIKVLVAGGIVLWFTTPKDAPVAANPRKRKNPAVAAPSAPRRQPSELSGLHFALGGLNRRINEIEQRNNIYRSVLAEFLSFCAGDCVESMPAALRAKVRKEGLAPKARRRPPKLRLVANSRKKK
ncbi:hypothetical protein CMI47_07250 [Candidatus Pacearchaeota archaeon]|nr:hypothetical protein [Candidatus Pacearchaeota archaeon]|tara:strand:- start:3172 stop:3678 length:507 start_codon:yes stop_codon:yes gene_type:complete